MKAAFGLGIEVYRPAIEGGRYDMIFGLERRLIRVQCKWARLYRDVVVVRCYSSRRARSGLVRRRYSAEDIDAFAAYCPELDCSYFIPFAAVADTTTLHLRVAPTRNNQRSRIHHAAEFDFGARLKELIAGP